MAAQSTYLRTKLVSFLAGTAYSPPATVYIGLFVTPLNADDLGTEVSGGGYVRKAITFAAASGGSIASSADITWTPLDSAATRTIFAWGIYDASSAGNLLAFGSFTNPFTVAANRNCTIPAGGITLSRPTGPGLTETFATSWLDKVFRNQTFAAPASLHLAMFTVAPDDDGAGGTEVTGGSYARQTVTLTPSAATGTFNAATFAPLDSAEANDVVAHGWYDASSGGNLLAWWSTYSDDTALEVAANDDVEVAASALTVVAR